MGDYSGRSRHEDIHLIKDRLPIDEALSIYAGAKFNRDTTGRKRVNIICPFHHDNSPSMTVYMDSNKFRCHAGSCGQAGDVIDVVCISQNVSTGEAIKIIKRDLNIDGSIDEETSSRIYRRRLEIEKIKIDREEFDRAKSILEWLERAITERSKLICDDYELDLWSPYIRRNSIISYHLDCLIGAEPATNQERVSIITLANSATTSAFVEKIKELSGFCDKRHTNQDGAA
jgi:hypothetical protein